LTSKTARIVAAHWRSSPPSKARHRAALF